jgi:primosomal protein N' (replication factor Y) (superfamily II helicase)
MQRGEGKFAQIIIPSPLKQPLTYGIPPSLRDHLKIGMRVLVPLGREKTTGLVADFVPETPLELKKVKEILACPDDRAIVDPSLMELGRWASRYYLATLGEVLATMLPSGLRVKSRRIVAARPGEFPLGEGVEKKIFHELRRSKGKLPLQSLSRRFRRSEFYPALERLIATGAVEIRERTVTPRKKIQLETAPDEKRPFANPNRVVLTGEQQRAVSMIDERLKKGGFETFLLYGVTGSGKTEVYLRLIEEARRTGRRSLILIPEISLTPQLLDRLQQRFPEKVGVLHSALTPSERWSHWWNILDGRVDVVVGARSAIFAPVPDLGLIVVDEEHDPSYKQQEGLRYHARDLAVVRGRLLGCPVVLGSATPALETFENCQRGRYRLLELTQRVEQRPLPAVEVIDLKSVHQANLGTQGPKPLTLFSPRLTEALQENFRRGQQSLLFLNRRGFANFLQCRRCGFVLRCPHCSVSMTFHLKQRSVVCHHCGFAKPPGDLCPGCGALTLSGIGFGTEQVERELARLLPQARLARMDRDTTSQRGSQERLIRQWEKGEMDVLVGTQMISKGHDVSGVTLVGAILADLSLNLPDFRAAERTFQLLSQVAGRAGRGKEPGRVIIQTYMPDHYTLQYVITHDYKGFFASEIEYRRSLNYPPFSRLVQLRVEGLKAQEVQAKARKLGEELGERQKRDLKLQEQIEILGPAPAPIERLRRRYRWQILLKGKRSAPLLELAYRAREIISPSRTARLYVDVDPYNML